MNFSTVKEAGGKNVIMLGQIIEFKGEGVGQTGKPWKKVIVEDDYRERHTVTIRGNLPPADAVNKPAQFTLSTFQADYQGQPYMGYSGFCDILPYYGQYEGQPATQQQQAPQGPQQAQQQPQQRQGAQQRQVQQRRPQQPQPAPRDFDKEARGKCRFGLYQALLQYGRDAEELNRDIPMLQAVEGLVEKSMNGIGDNLDKPAPQQTFKQAAVAAPKQTMGEAIKDAEAHRDKQQAQINAEQEAGDGHEDQGPLTGNDIPF